MPSLPLFIPYTFIAITVAVLAFVLFAVNKATPKKSNFAPTIVGTILIVWLFLTALATFYGFFENIEARPPRLFIVFLVNLVALVILFTLPVTRAVLLKLPITTLTFIHIIRVPVELVLWWLANAGALDHQLTFEGSNFDILVGVTAPFAAILMLGLRSKSKFAATVWHLVGLGMLANIVIMAVRASPYFFNPASFDQPNIAVLHFPFIWLPAFVVPVVFFSHIIALYQLLTVREE